MRADRLLSIVMLLQEHGRMTAAELARAVEVSVRTIYRDVEALSMAGIPVYTDRGARGGVVLLESYRSGLTGLTAAEIGALFLTGVPAPLVELGVSEALKSAHRKLAAAAVELSRAERQPQLNEVYLDSIGWFRPDKRPPNLSLVQQAVRDKRQLQITYRHPMPGEPEIAIEVEPYGLVSKANVWYLVGRSRGKMRVFLFPRIVEVSVGSSAFERAADFDLAEFWRAWCEDVEGNRPRYTVDVRVSQAYSQLLLLRPGDGAGFQVLTVGAAGADGWNRMILAFAGLEEARQYLLGMGGGVEVLTPEALRLSLADYARQILDVYSGAGDRL